MYRRCKRCREPLPSDLPGFHTFCRPCFILQKKQEEVTIREQLEAERRRADRAEAELWSLRRAGRSQATGQAGGEVKQTLQALGFDGRAVMRLIQLCHPDRHDNSELANEMTRLLLEVRRRLS